MTDKPRMPTPVRRMGTEVIADKRTHRRRVRSADERADIEAQLEEEWQDIEEWLDEMDDILGSDEDEDGFLDDYFYARGELDRGDIIRVHDIR